jgi:Flp pilus assembly protein TadG
MTSQSFSFRRLLSGLRRQDGSAILEVALVMPTFLLLLFGFFEYSYALTSYMSAIYATSMGARYAALHSAGSGSQATTTQVQAVVQANLLLPGSALNSANTPIVYYGNRNGGTNNSGNYTGDLVGVGFFTYPGIKVPFLTTAQSPLIMVQSYRIISR